MSLLLCRQESVKHPFYMEKLGIHLYSSPELCYVIYNNLLLILDDFVDESLITFIRDELNMDFLATKLENWIASGENQDELPLVILQECHYYRPEEIVQLRQKIKTLRKQHPATFAKGKGDDLFRRKQYRKAIAIYEKLLTYPEDQVVDDKFVGQILHNLGMAHACMFQFDKAAKVLKQAYERLVDDTILKHLYYLTRMTAEILLDESHLAQEEGLEQEWEQTFQAVSDGVLTSQPMLEFTKLFQKDSIKRRVECADLIQTWKQTYRAM